MSNKKSSSPKWLKYFLFATFLIVVLIGLETCNGSGGNGNINTDHRISSSQKQSVYIQSKSTKPSLIIEVESPSSGEYNTTIPIKIKLNGASEVDNILVNINSSNESVAIVSPTTCTINGSQSGENTCIVTAVAKSQIGASILTASTSNGNIMESSTLVYVSKKSYAYVTNNASNTISMYRVDPSTGKLIPLNPSTIATDSNPDGIISDSAGKYIYVANTGSNDIGMYSIDSNNGLLVPLSKTNVPTDMEPRKIIVDPTGKYAYVTSTFNHEYNGTVSSYRINQTGELIPNDQYGTKTVTLRNPYGIIIDPSGSYAYVANAGTGFTGNFGSVSMYNITQDGILHFDIPYSSVPLVNSPTGSANSIAVDPFGSYIYVTDNNSNSISIYKINKSGYAGQLTPIESVITGVSPNGIVIDNTGKYVYVANGASNSVSMYEINELNNKLLPIGGGSISAGTRPYGIILDSSGQYIYVTNSGSSSVSIYKKSSNGALTQISSVSSGSRPYGIALAKTNLNIISPLLSDIPQESNIVPGSISIKLSSPYLVNGQSATVKVTLNRSKGIYAGVLVMLTSENTSIASFPPAGAAMCLVSTEMPTCYARVTAGGMTGVTTVYGQPNISGYETVTTKVTVSPKVKFSLSLTPYSVFSSTTDSDATVAVTNDNSKYDLTNMFYTVPDSDNGTGVHITIDEASAEDCRDIKAGATCFVTAKIPAGASLSSAFEILATSEAFYGGNPPVLVKTSGYITGFIIPPGDLQADFVPILTTRNTRLILATASIVPDFNQVLSTMSAYPIYVNFKFDNSSVYIEPHSCIIYPFTTSCNIGFKMPCPTNTSQWINTKLSAEGFHDSSVQQSFTCYQDVRK